MMNNLNDLVNFVKSNHDNPNVNISLYPNDIELHNSWKDTDLNLKIGADVDTYSKLKGMLGND